MTRHRNPARRLLLAALLLLSSVSLAVGQEWKSDGPYVVKEMGDNYRAGGSLDDKEEGVKYFTDPAERERYRIHFVEGPDGVTRMMRLDDSGQLAPIDTRGLVEVRPLTWLPGQVRRFREARIGACM